MKRFSLFLLLVLFDTKSGYSQQAESFIAPNFTFLDINGNQHTLYDYLDQGKTVYIDFFTTWCVPCWNYHNSNAFKQLYQQHGPAGLPGVDASTSNDVMVFAIEVEGGNSTSQIFGTGSQTVGNWTTGVNYPIIDVNPSQVQAFKDSWQVTAYPTIYRICRDRIALRILGTNPATLYQNGQNYCPNYAPVAAADAKYFDFVKPRIHCNTISPSIIFQNYSTQPLTAATIKTYYDGVQVNSFNWTGNVPPMNFVTATIPIFNLPFSPYKWPLSFKVSAVNDIHPQNDSNNVVVYKSKNYQMADVLPFVENFNPPFTSSFANKWMISDRLITTMSGSFIGPDGQPNPMVIASFNILSQKGVKDTMFAGSYDFSSTSSPMLSFYVSYAQRSDGVNLSNDKIEWLLSNNCGETWIKVFSKSGGQLASSPPTNNYYSPQSSTDWKRELVLLSQGANYGNVILAMTAEADGGNSVHIDSFRVFAGIPSSVSVTKTDQKLSVYPNPASDLINISFGENSTGGNLRILDALGRIVIQRPLDNIGKLTLDISSLTNGVYSLIVTNEKRTQKANFVVSAHY